MYFINLFISSWSNSLTKKFRHQNGKFFTKTASYCTTVILIQMFFFCILSNRHSNFVTNGRHCWNDMSVFVYVRLTIKGIICWSTKSRPSTCQLLLLHTLSSATSPRPQTSCPSRWHQLHQLLNMSTHSHICLCFWAHWQAISSSVVSCCIKIS